jgi:hypothetical protein
LEVQSCQLFVEVVVVVLCEGVVHGCQCEVDVDVVDLEVVVGCAELDDVVQSCHPLVLVEVPVDVDCVVVPFFTTS